MKTQKTSLKMAMAMIAGLAVVSALGFALLQDEVDPGAQRTGLAEAGPDISAETIAFAKSAPTDSIATVPYAPSVEAAPIEEKTAEDTGAPPLVTLAELKGSTQKNIRYRIAGSSLMDGLEHELQLESLATTPQKWEEIYRAITDADRSVSPFLAQARKVLDPVLTKLIEEGRADPDDPMVMHRVRRQGSYGVRHIVAISSQPGTLSQSTYTLRYQLGTNREFDTTLEPIEREMSRRSAELGDTLRAILARP